MTGDLISRARAGDGEAFRGLAEPHRRELLVHCYRMLGSFQDAQDAVQDTLLAAWQGLASFEGRSSLRTWLSRIATHRCLNARRSASRRLAQEWDVPHGEPPEPTRLGEVIWLQPLPEAMLTGAIDVPLGPEARYEQTESISLAFVTALQVLPPRQLAVLILREVLGFPASEEAIVAKFLRAWESADLDALVDLLTDDVFVSMPPMPFEYQGRDVVARVLRQHLPLGPQVRPRADTSQRRAGVRSLPARTPRHQPRHRPLRPHPHRRADLRHDPLREQRAPIIRATPITPEPIASGRSTPSPAA